MRVIDAVKRVTSPPTVLGRFKSNQSNVVFLELRIWRMLRATLGTNNARLESILDREEAFQEKPQAGSGEKLIPYQVLAQYQSDYYDRRNIITF